MAATGPRLAGPEEDDIAASASLEPRSGNTKIEYSAELIERIRAETVDAFLRLAHGGLEIAGVLFGTRLGNTIHITATRPINCEHARGPSLTFSNRDEQELVGLLTAARQDPELQGLEPLGWYVSHTRRPFALADTDMVVFDRFFSQPLQVTAVVRPEATGLAQFRLFARDESGAVDLQRPSLEFTSHPSPTRVKPELPALPAAGGPPQESASLLPVKLDDEKWIVTYDRQTEPRALAPVTQVRVSNFILIMAGVVSALLAGICAVWFYSLPQPTQPVPLRVTESGQQLRIAWDPSAAVVQQARSGSLEIKDVNGSPVRIDLEPQLLRTGSVLYNKPSDKVEIHLRLIDENRHVSESMVYFLAREQPALKVESPTTVAGVVPAPLPPVQVSREIREKPALRPPDKPVPSETRTVPAVPLRVFTRPSAPAKAVSTVEPVIEAPKIPLGQTQPGAASVAALHPAVSAPPPVVVEKPKTDAPKQSLAPTSGRLIWTGDLHRGAVLKLTTRGASAGALNGALPGVPVKVSVHPAELLDGAIAIFSSDPNTRQSAEAPSRHNGWNVTLFKFDPKRAHDVVMVETPGQGNDWKQLVLKAANHTTIIVIDWRQVEN